jgi:hypothetical protein
MKRNIYCTVIIEKTIFQIVLYCKKQNVCTCVCVYVWMYGCAYIYIRRISRGSNIN